MLACRQHWFALPPEIRKLIWRTYRPGQEVDKRPSREYLDAFKQAEDFWNRHLANAAVVNDCPLFETALKD
jgi:hypothetical protein